jgi:hypothetical protein
MSSAAAEDIPTICAYCEKKGKYTHIRGPDLGPDYRKDPELRKKMSHGICKPCYDEVMADFMKESTSPQRRALLREVDERLRNLQRQAQTDTAAGTAYIRELIRTQALTVNNIRTAAILGCQSARYYCIQDLEENIDPMGPTENIADLLQRLRRFTDIGPLRDPVMQIAREFVAEHKILDHLRNLNLPPQSIQAAISDIESVLNNNGLITLHDNLVRMRDLVYRQADFGTSPHEARVLMDWIPALGIANMIIRQGYHLRARSEGNWPVRLVNAFLLVLLWYSNKNGRQATQDLVRDSLMPATLRNVI